MGVVGFLYWVFSFARVLYSNDVIVRREIPVLIVRWFIICPTQVSGHRGLVVGRDRPVFLDSLIPAHIYLRCGLVSN